MWGIPNIGVSQDFVLWILGSVFLETQHSGVYKVPHFEKCRLRDAEGTMLLTFRQARLPGPIPCEWVYVQSNNSTMLGALGGTHNEDPCSLLGVIWVLPGYIGSI